MIYKQAEKQRSFPMIDNYIYLHHTNTLIIIPQYPEAVSDTMSARFGQSDPIARSAPIFSYAGSGPRQVQVSVRLHRDMMREINYGKSNLNLDLNDDYVDTIVKQLQAVALPRYAAAQKMVDPPLVSVRWGTDIYCKGVVSGQVTTTYSGPILETKTGDKYAIVDISFNISEVEPYDAETVMQVGGYRGISKTLERNIWKMKNSTNATASLIGSYSR